MPYKTLLRKDGDIIIHKCVWNVNSVTHLNFPPNASILQGAKTHLVNMPLLASSGNY